jgi:hypothetical protein
MSCPSRSATGSGIGPTLHEMVQKAPGSKVETPGAKERTRCSSAPSIQ